MNFQALLSERSAACAKRLLASDEKLILAESCTSGLLAASLSQTPGISKNFCGSFVTYRESLKIDALGVSSETLQAHTAVSAQTSHEMVRGALQRCTEATLALAITGHLGPDAPNDLDGKVFVAIGKRDSEIEQAFIQLSSGTRQDRQAEAAIAALEQLESWLKPS